MDVRECSRDDVEGILHVINESNRAYYKDIIPPDHFKEPVLTKHELVGLMRRMVFYSYVADDETVGVAALEGTAAGSGQVHWVYVLPDHHRKGIGSTLMTHIESEARRRGIDELTVITSERAHWARDFYEEMGFALVGTKETPEGGIAVYRKELDAIDPG